MLSWVLNQPAVASVAVSDAFGWATSAMKQKQAEIEFVALDGCKFTKETSMAHTDFRSDLQSSNEIEITVTGRTSGRSLSYPVWFALDGNTLYLIPVKGSDTEWYKNLRKTPSIRLQARGKALTASAGFLTDQVQLDKVLEKFRDKHGRNVKSYHPKLDVAVEVPHV
jgi:deazaflavin-dependent oxidoreductase (nitroreductase family)